MIKNKNKIAANTLILFSIFGIMIAVMVIISLIPSDMVWGGRVINHNQILLLEFVSLAVNILMIWFVSMRAEYAKKRVSRQLLNTTLIIFMAMMIMNTIGNITAKTIFEQLMSVVTFVSAFCFYILVKNQE
jgi:hypothetical protein